MLNETAARKFYPLEVSSLLVGRIPRLNLYIRREEDPEPILFRSASVPLTPQQAQELAANNIHHLWLPERDYEVYQRFLAQFLPILILDPNLPVRAKCSITYDYSIQAMRQAFDSNDTRQVIETSKEMLKHVIAVLFSDERATHNFIALASTDYALFSHSVNVCLFGMALARRALGISEETAMEEFGPGLLLHDLGKLRIPREILVKEGKLTLEERQLIKTHPETGLEMIRDFMTVTPEVESIILHHHERLDGSGYPFGLNGKYISTHARICAIVDIFDAISTDRPFQKRKSTFETFQVMRQELSNRIDEKLLNEFILLFQSPDE
ncbi:MAG TPA: HD domain-containing phosphohydrolase [bacterium]|nr:HD domain-containing phosphohydrolase [bacterium]HOL94763.1 HD domain-containing phosphohydrolase [bacterium]HXK96050.1 HD domain-containing phosphohydrolase [bacterium]